MKESLLTLTIYCYSCLGRTQFMITFWIKSFANHYLSSLIVSCLHFSFRLCIGTMTTHSKNDWTWLGSPNDCSFKALKWGSLIESAFNLRAQSPLNCRETSWPRIPERIIESMWKLLTLRGLLHKVASKQGANKGQTGHTPPPWN